MDLERKLAGVLAPVFALRSERDMGCGDVATLREFVDWAAARRLRVVQVLPVNETGRDNSPYNALASSALDPTTIDVGAEGLPELGAEARDRIVAGCGGVPPAGERVDYARVKALKLALVEEAHRVFRSGDAPVDAAGYRGFREEHRGWLHDYVLFRALVEENGGAESWDAWLPEQRTAASARRWLVGRPERERRRLLERMDFFAYAQWVAYRQWEELRRHAGERGVFLMGDLPFGVSYFSSDVFAAPELFDLEWSGGAPPERAFELDPFTVRWGQNWGIPIYRWDVMRRDGFAWWKRRVSSLLRVFHMFRVDHILGFYRVYRFPWRPERNQEFLPLDEGAAAARTGGRLPGFYPRGDDAPEDREANRRGGEEVLRALQACAPPLAVVGEDLGVVPDYVPGSLAGLGIAGMKVPMWQRGAWGGLMEGRDYPRLSLATYATHDHAPLRVLWEGGLTRARGEDPGVAARARDELLALARFAGVEVDPGEMPVFDGRVHEGLVAGLLRANSWLVMFQITDLLGSVGRFNVPGSVGEGNWTLRLPLTVGEMAREPAFAARMERVRGWIEESGRAG